MSASAPHYSSVPAHSLNPSSRSSCSLKNLAQRAAAAPSEPLSFDKDDDDALDFVTATANLRCFVYDIPRKTRFEVKEMAGNIIPAIASTNAIIAGQIVFQAIQALQRNWADAHFVALTRASGRMLNGYTLPKPNPACGVCSVNYGMLRVPSLQTTLGEIMNKVVTRPRSEGGLGFEEDAEVSLYHGSRLLVDPDFDDNLASSLHEMSLPAGAVLSVVDEGDEPNATFDLFIDVAPEGSTATDVQLRLRDGEAAPKKKYVAPPKEEESDLSDDDDDIIQVLDQPPPPIVGKKRSAADAADAGVAATEENAKKRKVADEADPSIVIS